MPGKLPKKSNDELEKQRLEFSFWLDDMDVALGYFVQMLPSDITTKLDYSLNSLEALESWLLNEFHSIEEMKGSIQNSDTSDRAISLLDRSSRYIGETFIRLIGGHWELSLDSPKNAYYGLPIITGFKKNPTPICPRTLVSACIDRRTGKYFRTVFENVQKRL